MLLGNAGIVTAISSLILTFIKLGSDGSTAVRIVVLVSGLVALWVVASSGWVDERLSNLIRWALSRYTKLDVRDYASLLRLTGEYRVYEMQIEEDDWCANRTLGELKLRNEGIVVLGVTRGDGRYIGAPDGSTEVLPDDVLILYGRSPALEKLDTRRKGLTGDREHEEETTRQRAQVAQEKEGDRASK
jgi:NhaP-type Na+/H+ and K+/H+ antiporter